MPNTILIADDDPDIVSLIKLYLEAEGYRTIEAYSGDEALQCLQDNSVELALLDIMMPGMDGLQLLRAIRQTYSIPVIFLSARGRDVDKIAGLKLGADDYITKPFSPLEVAARVEAHLRRSYELNEGRQQPARIAESRVGNVRLDHDACMLYIEDRAVSLSALEYKLLKLFMSAPGRVFTKKQLFEQAWDEHYYADDNAIMVQISRLRDKIEACPKKPEYIKTIRGLGYRFAKKEELKR